MKLDRLRCSLSSWRPLALAALLALAGCGGASDAELLASARKHLADKQPDAARLELKSLLQNNAGSGEARLMLGRIMLDAGETAAAEAELRRAFESGVSKDAVVPLLAEAMMAQGKGKLLLLQFGSVQLQDEQADAALRTQLATAQASDGDTRAATALLDQVSLRAPGYLPAQLLGARLTAMRGDIDAASRQVDAVLTKAPDDASAWALKGDLLAPRGGAGTDPGPALAAWRKSLALKPGNVAVQSAVISALIAAHDFTGAQAQFVALQKVAPKHPQTWFFDAVLSDQRGDDKHAREVAQLLLRGAPDNLRVQMLAGQIEAKAGALAQAEALFSKAVQAAPKAELPRRMLAQVLLRSGQGDKALLALRPLLDADAPAASDLALAAQAQLMRGDRDAADKLFRQAAKLEPGDARLRTALALSELANGQDSAGLSELQAITASDTGTSADLALINARMQRKDLAGALRAVDALAAKTPGRPLPDQLRGRIAMQRGDRSAARQAFTAALTHDADYMPALAGLAALDLADGQAAAAQQRFEALLKRQPEHAGAMMALAELAARSGKPAESMQWLERAVKAEPANPLPRALLVDSQLAARQPARALATAQAAVTALPDNADLLGRLGRAQMISGSQQQAIGSFTRMASLQPRSPLPQLLLAEAQQAAGDASAAAASMRRAGEIAPDALPVQQAAVRLALAQNKPEQALTLSRQLQSRRPGAAAGFVMEGDIALYQKDWPGAAAAFRKALAKEAPGDSAPAGLHAALLAGGQAAEADRFAAEWRKSHPGDLVFLRHLGDTALAGGKFDIAEQQYRQVLERAPQEPLALNNLAYVLAMQHKPGAAALAEQALKVAPGTPALMDTLAFCLAAEQQLPRAIELQTQVVALAPEVGKFRLQLARLYLQAGDKSGARTELQTLARLGDKFPQQAEVAKLLERSGG